MNDSLFILLITAVIGAIAWLVRFAINEYEIYKKFEISSKIFKYGGFYFVLFLTWSISARTIYSKMLHFIPTEKIEEANKDLLFVMADKSTIYAMAVGWFVVWFFSIGITDLAKFINNERKAEKK